MARSAKIKTYIDLDSSGMRRGVADAEKSLARLKGAGKVALTGIGAAAAGAVPLIFKATEAASDLSEQVNKSQAVFKGSSAEIQKWADTTATKLGISKRAALEATGTFGNMLVPMGFARDRAAEMSQRMVTLAADMASFNNASPEETLDALRAGLAGESEPLRKFGVFLSDARLKQEALTLGIYDGKGALDANAKAQATYALILKDSKDAQGDFARTSDGLANSQRIARAQLENTAASIGATFIPVAAKVLTVVNDVLQSAQRNWPRFKKFTTDAFEDVQAVARRVMAWFDANILPTIQAIVSGARRFWDAFGDDIKRIMAFVGREIERQLIIIRETIELVLALIRGDWGEAWSSLKTIVKTVFAGLLDYLRTIPRVMLSVGVKIGKAIAQGVIDGLESLAQTVAEKATFGLVDFGGGPGGGVVPRSIGGSGRPTSPGAPGGRAMGGFIPGRFDGRDDVPVRVSRGEVILNPTQQRIVGIDRIVATLRATGGVVGGSRFASGGIIGGAWKEAADFARRQVGEPYVWGAGHSYGDSRGWDCSGFASNVAARVPGYTGGIGTTMSLYPKSKPARGNEPVVFGFSGMETNDPRKQHMGIRVGGVWYDAGSGGVQTGRTSWPSGLRVPPGLEGLSENSAGGDPGPRGAPDQPTPRKRLANLLGRAGFSDVAANVMSGSLIAGVPDLSEGSAPSFTPSQDRSVSAAGRGARADARRAGKSPEQIAKAGDDAERAAEIKLLNKQLALAREDLSVLRTLKGNTLADFRRLGRKKVGAAGRAAKRKLMAQYRAKLRRITAEMSEVREEIEQLKDRLAEIGETIAEEQYEADYERSQEGAQAGTSADATSAEPSADQQAQLDQATARATTAERDAATGSAFIRTLFGSGSIDPGTGSVSVTINTLTPGDPAIQAEVARWIVGAFGGQGSVPASSFSLA